MKDKLTLAKLVKAKKLLHEMDKEHKRIVETFFPKYPTPLQEFDYGGETYVYVMDMWLLKKPIENPAAYRLAKEILS